MAVGKRHPPFPGFRLPYYTQVPDDLFDVLLPTLSGAELKVLLYLIRRTFGFKKDSDAVSLTQICEGIKRRDGTILDRGTGLHRETAVNALRALEERRIILAYRSTSAERGNETTTYRLHLVGESDQGGSENPTGGSRILPPPLVGAADPQETVQETEEQENDLLANKRLQDVRNLIAYRWPREFTRIRQRLEDYDVDERFVQAARRSLGMVRPEETIADFWRLLDSQLT